MWLPQGVSEPARGTRPLVRTPGWSRTQGVLTPPTRAQPGEPPLWSRFVYLGLGEWACLPPRRNPRPAGLLLFTSQQPKSNHDGPQQHRTSSVICFGAHQYPNSNMSNVLTQYLTLVGCIIHSLTAQQGGEWGLRNRRVGGCGNKQWGKHSIRPTTVVFLQRGAGAKFFFCDFFLRNPFLRRAQSKKLIFFLRFLFFAQNNTLDRELIISANS